ncbi:Bacterial alpha-L-rhamnosidase [Macrophomina phaseolina MS6]|uniref:alpha-L-rhamnosidase n=1 Tax=Macrophomina phaseolina (strain MS6) TaxID=1126212 RepID=K2R1X2_MACPH|nr:Bacterial alpha-L-rhamnosidase [Macrophomina phaseolina MS6]
MSVQLIDVRFEHHPDGFGIGTATPRLSWRFSHGKTPAENWQQSGYTVEISRQEGTQTHSFHVESSESVLNPWPTKPLTSRERVSVRVRAFGASERDGHQPDPAPTEWSHWHVVEAGLLQRSDWTGNFIVSPLEEPKDKPHRPVLFRKSFDSPATKEARAWLYITSLGVYEAHINGRRVGDLQMTPGWTSYRHRLQYQVFDVTELIQEGKNTIGVEVSEGWYAGRLTWGKGIRNFYGDKLATLVQLEIQTKDGVNQRIVSEESWKTHQSDLIMSELYDGEVYDARQHLQGWTSPTFIEGSNWKPSCILEFPNILLFAPDVAPVRVTQSVQSREIFRSRSGKTLVDFGQNLVGKVQIKLLHKPEGHTVKIRHAEVLEHGELGTRPLRNARAEDTVIFSNQPLKDWAPRFTFHGFRYVQLEGWSLDDDVPPSTENIAALVMHSDLVRTGQFSCSNDLVNRLHENVVWSMRGNFLSIPTDCPQRDERLGWTGDIQVFSPTASYLYQSAGFLSNWMQDVAAEQGDMDGIVPLVVPDVLGTTSWPSVPQAVWDDVAILVPWVLYQWSGDVEIVRRQYSSMRVYLDTSIRRGDDGLWDPDLWQLGDWLDPNAPPREPGLARTDGTLVADAYLVYVTGIMAKISDAVERPQETVLYQKQHDDLKAVFADKYIAPSGLLVGDSQTALALALAFSLHGESNPKQVRTAADRLARLVRYSKFRVSTGFAGTPLVLHALSSTDHIQLAYRMLLEEQCPSWLYPVTMGATTIWERWDSMLPDGSINPGEMTSFNHYALGSVANWLHTVVGGIRPLEPGWKKFLVSPVPGGTLTNAEVKFESPYGLVEAKWKLDDGHTRFVLRLNVPPNTTALLVLPGQKAEEGVWIGSGSHVREASFKAPGNWPPKAMYTQFQEGLE